MIIIKVLSTNDSYSAPIGMLGNFYPISHPENASGFQSLPPGWAICTGQMIEGFRDTYPEFHDFMEKHGYHQLPGRHSWLTLDAGIKNGQAKFCTL